MAARRRRILIVDDDEVMCEVLRAVLDLDEFVVETASSGEVARRRIGSFRPDVLVLDGGGPEPDGIALSRRLKSDPATANLPILLLTGRDLDRDRLGERVAWDDHMAKPVSPLALIERLASIGTET